MTKMASQIALFAGLAIVGFAGPAWSLGLSATPTPRLPNRPASSMLPLTSA